MPSRKTTTQDKMPTVAEVVANNTPVDLNAMRAEAPTRREFTIDGESFTVPSEMPIGVAYLIENGSMFDGLELWLGGKDELQRLLGTSFTPSDMKHLHEAVYGTSAGE